MQDPPFFNLYETPDLFQNLIIDQSGRILGYRDTHNPTSQTTEIGPGHFQENYSYRPYFQTAVPQHWQTNQFGYPNDTSSDEYSSDESSSNASGSDESCSDETDSDDDPSDCSLQDYSENNWNNNYFGPQNAYGYNEYYECDSASDCSTDSSDACDSNCSSDCSECTSEDETSDDDIGGYAECNNLVGHDQRPFCQFCYDLQIQCWCF